MRIAKYTVAALAALMLGAASAGAAVNVTFVKPDQYRDRDFRSASTRESIVADLTKYFEKLDHRYLKPGQRLDIEVLNARLAGQYEPWQRNFNDVRIMRDITPPRFEIRYTLRQEGKVIASGKETVSDINYLRNPSARNSSERFAYEKSMLRDWFRKRFVELRAPRG